MLLVLFQVGLEPLIEQLSKIPLVNAEEFKTLVDSGEHHIIDTRSVSEQWLTSIMAILHVYM